VAECAFIALGSNLGARAAYLASARAAISLIAATRLLAASRVEETVPFGPGAQGPYLNQMVAVQTVLPPAALLAALQRIEHALGRVRTARWGPRTIDLDLVRYGTTIEHSANLTLPHPGLASRDFWQREMTELRALLERAA
jgi:2-amino-4-hydroxy-6-hydroxymethyldihydropteridine diphosphokinase